MIVAAKCRVTAAKNGAVELEIMAFDGRKETYLIGAPGAMTLAKALVDGARATGAPTNVSISNRCHIPAPEGIGWRLGEPANGLLPLVFLLHPGVEIQVLLPPADSLKLVEQIAAARSLPGTQSAKQ